MTKATIKYKSSGVTTTIISNGTARSIQRVKTDSDNTLSNLFKGFGEAYNAQL